MQNNDLDDLDVDLDVIRKRCSRPGGGEAPHVLSDAPLKAAVQLELREPISSLVLLLLVSLVPCKPSSEHVHCVLT